jgi:DNA-binding beta-propeller fold protein YncE
VSHPRLAVFARQAKGQVAPLRIIEGQRTGLSRSSHGVFLDTVNNEVVAPSPLAGAIVVYGREQKGNTPPIRMIQGPKTHLNSPQGVAVDNVNHEIVVANDGALTILVFDRLANGDVAPLREIIGPATGIATPEGIVVDPVHDEIILADEGNADTGLPAPSLRVFRRTDNGNVAPIRVITGPSTGLLRPRQLQLDTERDELVLADRGLPQEFIYTPETQGYIGFWSRTDSGDQPPKRIIRGPRSQLSSPRAVYVDMENDEIGAGDTTSHSIMVYRRNVDDADEFDDRGDRDDDREARGDDGRDF